MIIQNLFYHLILLAAEVENTLFFKNLLKKVNFINYLHSAESEFMKMRGSRALRSVFYVFYKQIIEFVLNIFLIFRVGFCLERGFFLFLIIFFINLILCIKTFLYRNF